MKMDAAEYLYESRYQRLAEFLTHCAHQRTLKDYQKRSIEASFMHALDALVQNRNLLNGWADAHLVDLERVCAVLPEDMQLSYGVHAGKLGWAEWRAQGWSESRLWIDKLRDTLKVRDVSVTLPTDFKPVHPRIITAALSFLAQHLHDNRDNLICEGDKTFPSLVLTALPYATALEVAKEKGIKIKQIARIEPEIISNFFSAAEEMLEARGGELGDLLRKFTPRTLRESMEATRDLTTKLRMDFIYSHNFNMICNFCNAWEQLLKQKINPVEWFDDPMTARAVRGISAHRTLVLAEAAKK
jgi:hypothetical protein